MPCLLGTPRSILYAVPPFPFSLADGNTSWSLWVSDSAHTVLKRFVLLVQKLAWVGKVKWSVDLAFYVFWFVRHWSFHAAGSLLVSCVAMPYAAFLSNHVRGMLRFTSHSLATLVRWYLWFIMLYHFFFLVCSWHITGMMHCGLCKRVRVYNMPLKWACEAFVTFGHVATFQVQV